MEQAHTGLGEPLGLREAKLFLGVGEGCMLQGELLLAMRVLAVLRLLALGW